MVSIMLIILIIGNIMIAIISITNSTNAINDIAKMKEFYQQTIDELKQSNNER